MFDLAWNNPIFQITENLENLIPDKFLENEKYQYLFC